MAAKTYKEIINNAVMKNRSEAIVLLNMRPHISIPILYGVCYKKKMLLMQFCGHHTKSLTVWKLITTNHTKFTKNEWNNYLFQILLAMKHIHDSGYLHNDMKEDNVVISKNDKREWVPVIIDFSESCLITECKKRKYKSFHRHIEPAVLRETNHILVTVIFMGFL